MRPPYAAIALVVALTISHSPALAVSEGAPGIYQPLLVTSARAAGMGEMTALFADGSIAIWRNPGFLAHDRNFHFSRTWTQLLPSLTDDIWLRSVALTGSVPVSFVRVGGGVGCSKLSFGPSDIIDAYGNSRGTFEAYDRAYNLSGGILVWNAVGFGASYEHVKSKLAESIPELEFEGGLAHSNSMSAGIGIAPTIPLDLGPDAPGCLTVTPLFGFSLLHWWGEKLEYNSQDRPEPLARHSHLAMGLRLANEPKTTKGIVDPARLLAAEVTAGYERDKPGVNSNDEPIIHYGVEVKYMGFVSVRQGRIDDKDGEIIGDTWGYGIGLEDVLPFGFRYDWASMPQQPELGRVQRRDIVITFSPRFF